MVSHRVDRLHRQPWLRAAAAGLARDDRRRRRRGLGRSRAGVRGRVDTPALQQLRVRRGGTRARSSPSTGAERPTRRPRSAAVSALEHAATEAGLDPHHGRKVLEIRPPVPIDKGRVCAGFSPRNLRPRLCTSATISPTSTPLPAFAPSSATPPCASAFAPRRRPPSSRPPRRDGRRHTRRLAAARGAARLRCRLPTS